MLAATSYRYEQMKENKSLKDALKRQKEKVLYEDNLAKEEGERKRQELLERKSQWVEASEGAVNFKRNRNKQRDLENEILLTSKTSILVRQAALKKLLTAEWKMYEEELQSIGKAFYIQRL